MSEAVEVVCESVRIWGDADCEALEALWYPEAEIVAPAAWPEGGTRVGWPAIRAQFERLKADWKEDRIAVEEAEEVRPGLVFFRVRWTVTGAASGVPLDVSIWGIATVRDGRLARTEYFQDEAAARAALEG